MNYQNLILYLYSYTSYTNTDTKSNFGNSLKKNYFNNGKTDNDWIYYDCKDKDNEKTFAFIYDKYGCYENKFHSLNEAVKYSLQQRLPNTAIIELAKSAKSRYLSNDERFLTESGSSIMQRNGLTTGALINGQMQPVNYLIDVANNVCSNTNINALQLEKNALCSLFEKMKDIFAKASGKDGEIIYITDLD